MKIALIALIAATVASGTTLAFTQATTLAVMNDGFREVRVSSSAAADPPPNGMIFVPAGEVTIGTDIDRIDYLGDRDEAKIALVMAEYPRHKANVDSFFIDRTEVTNLQWKVYLDAVGREPGPELVQYAWRGGHSFPKGEDLLPITNVSFTDVQDFMAWAGKRLPSEEEWTLAARGPDDDRDYPWGKRWDSKACRSAANTPASRVAVGQYPSGASPFGALDMAGNVWEWVDSPFSPFDGYEPYRLNKGKRSKTIGTQFDRSYRVAKGGSFASPRDDLRIDARSGQHPARNDESLGFRAARSQMTGIDIITHSYRRLLPPTIQGLSRIDMTDVVAREVTSYGYDGQVITGHRFLAFAHPVAKKGAGLSRMRKQSRDEPVTLGILATSEPLEEPPLSAGDYLLAYKGKGESKTHKEKRKSEKRTGKTKPPEPLPVPSADPDSGGDDGGSSSPPGASAPWPGVNVASIVEDIEFPQDKEVILFYNVNNAVVGYTLLPEAEEGERADAVLTDENHDGKRWTIEFSHDNMPRNKKMPRFTIKLKLFGDGLGS